MNNFSLSVVLPAYNEEQNIKEAVQNCINYLSKNFSDFEILAVNDGSSDKTGDIISGLAEEYGEVRLINHETNRGYGAALNSGFENSTKEYIFLMDSDGQFNIRDLDKMTSQVTGENIVIGYRRNRADNVIRKLNSYLYGIYIKLFFDLKVKDVDCAFKLFSKSAFDAVKPIKSRGAIYSAELLIKFLKNGLEISEVGVNHYPRFLGTQSGAKLNVILQMFKESWVFRKELR